MKVYHQIWAILMLYPVFSGVCRGSEYDVDYVQYAEVGDNVTLVLNVSKEYEGIYTCEVTKYLYIIGEEVKAECLSEVSKPQSTIEWWINDAAVSPDMVTNRTTFHSTLRFNVSEHHLHGYEQDDMILKCSVKIKDGHKEVYWKTSIEEVKVSLHPTHPSIRGYLPAMFSGLASATTGPNLLTFLGLQCVVLATTSFTIGAF